MRANLEIRKANMLGNNGALLRNHRETGLNPKKVPKVNEANREPCTGAQGSYTACLGMRECPE